MMTSKFIHGRFVAFCSGVLLLAINAPSQTQWGIVDPTFDPAIGAGPVPYHRISCMAVQPDSKILVGGGFSQFQGVTRKGIARLLSNGALDFEFDFELPITYSTVNAIVRDDAGRIVIGGQFFLPGYDNVMVLRLMPDGSMDPSFTPVVGNGTVNCMLPLLNEQGFIIGGGFNLINGVARNSIAQVSFSGDLEVAQYGGSGFLENPDDGQDQGTVNDLVSDGNDGIFVIGDFDRYNDQPLTAYGFAKLYPNGVWNDAFDHAFTNQGSLAGIRSVLPLADGTTLVGGTFDAVDGIGSTKLVKLGQGGAIAQVFDFSTDPTLSQISSIEGLAAYADDGVLAIYQYNSSGSTSYQIVGLDQDGEYLSGQYFGSGMGGGAFEDILVTEDQEIMLCGSFTSFNDTPRRTLVRLLGRDGPGLASCLGAQFIGLGTPVVEGDVGSVATDVWIRLDVDFCNRLTLSNCDDSGVVDIETGLFTSCPVSAEMIPFTTTANACGGEDHSIAELPAGSYWLRFTALGAYSLIMSSESCGVEDCNGDPDGSAWPFTPCDDLDPGTINDIWTEECECAGVLPFDCAGVLNGPALPGTPCDDGVLFTTNDIYTLGCSCEGHDCIGQQGGVALPGAPCDDERVWTYDDRWTVNCECVGQGVVGLDDPATSSYRTVVFPNPVVDRHLDVLLAESGPWTVLILDATGREVFLVKEQRAVNGRLSIDLPDLGQGDYQLRLKNGNTNRTGSFVKL